MLALLVEIEARENLAIARGEFSQNAADETDALTEDGTIFGTAVRIGDAEGGIRVDVIAAMLNGAIARLSIDEGITPERIRVVTTWDRRLWRLLVDKAEVFQVFDHAGAITGTWAYPPEAAHAASLWMEGADDDGEV